MRILMNAGGEGGGGNTPPPAPAPPQPADDKGVDLVKAVEGLVAKHGDTTAALRVLLGENYSYRDQLRDARAKLPADGAVVLTGEDARHWSSYQGLGKPGDLKKALDEGKTAADEVVTYRKAEHVKTVAEVSKFRPGVLGTLIERDKLTVEVVEDKDKDGKPLKDKDGTPVRVAIVKGEGDKVTRLADHAKAHWGDFLPSLEIKAEAPRPIGTPNARRPAPNPTGQGADREPPKRPRSGF